jgi:hypothetical protein
MLMNSVNVSHETKFRLDFLRAKMELTWKSVNAYGWIKVFVLLFQIKAIAFLLYFKIYLLEKIATGEKFTDLL